MGHACCINTDYYVHISRLCIDLVTNIVGIDTIRGSISAKSNTDTVTMHSACRKTHQPEVFNSANPKNISVMTQISYGPLYVQRHGT